MHIFDVTHLTRQSVNIPLPARWTTVLVNPYSIHYEKVNVSCCQLFQRCFNSLGCDGKSTLKLFSAAPRAFQTKRNSLFFPETWLICFRDLKAGAKFTPQANNHHSKPRNRANRKTPQQNETQNSKPKTPHQTEQHNNPTNATAKRKIEKQTNNTTTN